MPSWFKSPWFNYPISRPVTLRYFNPAVLVLGVIYTIFITLINVIAVGYETTSTLSTSFNDSRPLWYEYFIPKGTGIYQVRTCSGSPIKVKERMCYNHRPFIVVNESFGYNVSILSWLHSPLV
jgi:hypothetical protein